MIRRLFRRLIQPLLWWAYRKYSAKKRWYTSRGLRLCLYPSVFHPVWMLTTTTFLTYINNLSIANKKVLELGAGNGLIALWCARAKAKVTASDINPAAIQSINESAVINQLELTTIGSDLFDNIPSQQFDYIFINPPYFPQVPKNHQEMAFFCGADFEYFHNLYQQLEEFTHSRSTILMILTDDCDLSRLGEIARSYHWQWKKVHSHKKMGEWHFIYQLSSTKK